MLSSIQSLQFYILELEARPIIATESRTSSTPSRGKPLCARQIHITRLPEVSAVVVQRLVMGVLVRVIARVAQTPDAGPKGAIIAARAPSPTCAGHDGQVVVPEAVNSGDNANEEPEKNIEAVVAEIEPSRRGDEDGQTKWHEGNGEEVEGRRSGLSSKRLKTRIVLGATIGDTGLVAWIVGFTTCNSISIRTGIKRRRGFHTHTHARRESSMLVVIRGPIGISRGHHEWQRHGELARQKQRQVDEPRGGSSRVAAGITPEAIVELVRVGLRADIARVEARSVQTAHRVCGRVGEVGLASRQKIRSGLAAHVLDAADEEEGRANGHEEAQPADVELPEFALPYVRRRGVLGDRISGNEDQRDEEDDDDGH